MINNLEELKSQIDIVDIISNSLELKKNGANFKACCPFHGEDTPSFVVSPVKQIYKCFGCSASGDAIKFVQEYKKLDFVEAVEDIANYLNFTLEYSKQENKKDYTNIIETFNNYYKDNLKDEELKYLLDRGITKESISDFEIGFANDSKNQIDFLNKNFLNINEAIEIGIFSTGDNNKLYSRLIKRITFPIRNHTKKLIGFGGRTTINHNAKYVNSIQTKLFDKSKNLYGLDKAKEFIYKKKVIVITEGYLDVIMMHQIGIKTAVATMGTALTKEHILLMKKMDIKVILCYDGDRAGVEASYKASLLLSKAMIDGSVVLFKDGYDPADMIKDNKKNELIDLMKNGKPIIIYILEYIVNSYNILNPIEKDKARGQTLSFLKSLNNNLVANEYLEYLSNILRTDIKFLQLDFIPKKQELQNTKKISLNADIELNIIYSATEDFNCLNFLLDNYQKGIFKTHLNELEAVLNGNMDSLVWLSLKDDIRAYSDIEFKKQFNILISLFLKSEISNIKLSNLSNFDKLSKIKELQKELFEIQRKIPNYK